MPDPREALLDELIALSAEMLALARAGSWEQAMAHQERRDGLARRAFEGGWSGQTEYLATKMAEIQRLDRALVELSRQHRDTLQQERLKLNRAKKSVRFYEG